MYRYIVVRLSGLLQPLQSLFSRLELLTDSRSAGADELRGKEKFVLRVYADA
jgi:hypothetical protein